MLVAWVRGCGLAIVMEYAALGVNGRVGKRSDMRAERAENHAGGEKS